MNLYIIQYKKPQAFFTLFFWHLLQLSEECGKQCCGAKAGRSHIILVESEPLRDGAPAPTALNLMSNIS
jgi:hypothetical protein